MHILGENKGQVKDVSNNGSAIFKFHTERKLYKYQYMLRGDETEFLNWLHSMLEQTKKGTLKYKN